MWSLTCVISKHRYSIDNTNKWGRVWSRIRFYILNSKKLFHFEHQTQCNRHYKTFKKGNYWDNNYLALILILWRIATFCFQKSVVYRPVIDLEKEMVYPQTVLLCSNSCYIPNPSDQDGKHSHPLTSIKCYTFKMTIIFNFYSHLWFEQCLRKWLVLYFQYI